MRMPNSAANPVPRPPPDPLAGLDTAVIAPRPTRRYRAAAFQAYVFGASVVFVVLAIVAHTVAYFPIDLVVTRAVQAYHGPLFERVMFATSWFGFFPQAGILSALVIIGLYAFGLRRESAALLFATASTGVGALVKLLVTRPRPSADMVHVFRQLNSPGFPSGHVLSTVAVCGFLVFLCFTLLQPSAGRTALLVGLSLLIALMGLSRIYLGQHWFSDVMGAYLFGSLWLALTIRLYRRGNPRVTVHSPAAPGAPASPRAGTA
jgi:undecaprenyl-diphosphatase